MSKESEERRKRKKVRKTIFFLGHIVVFFCIISYFLFHGCKLDNSLAYQQNGHEYNIQLEELKENSWHLDNAWERFEKFIKKAEKGENVRENLQKAFDVFCVQIMPYFVIQSGMMQDYRDTKYLELHSKALELLAHLFCEIRNV